MNPKRKALLESRLVQTDSRMRLSRHPTGRGKRPPAKAVLQHVFAARMPAGISDLAPLPRGHRVLSMYVRKRWLHPHNGQALLKYKGRVWNVARLLLEFEQTKGEVFVNVCGFEECVEPTHWQPTKRVSGVPVIHAVNDQWVLVKDDWVVERDTVIVAHIAMETELHVVRVLMGPDFDPHAHQFVTVCGVVCDPSLLVIEAKRDATCKACLQ